MSFFPGERSPLGQVSAPVPLSITNADVNASAAIASSKLATDVVTAPDNASTKIVHGSYSTGAQGTVDQPIYRGNDNTQAFGETFSTTPLVLSNASANGNQIWMAGYSETTTQVVCALCGINNGGTPTSVRWGAIGS